MISDFVRKSSLLAALVFVACGKDSSGPSPVPTTVALSSGSAQSATVATVVTPALTFSVKDQNGNSLAGVPVTITVTGGGTLTGSPTTTTAGETPVGTWTLGQIVGVNTLTIKAGNLEPKTFSITTVAGPPAQIIASAGSGQTAFAGSTLSPITLRVADQFGNGVGIRLVTITVQGGGMVSPPSGTTNANGELSGIVWTLGRSALPQSLSVSSGSVVSSIPATVQTSYVVEVRYFGAEPEAHVRTAFDNAGARIRGAIVQTLGLVPFTNVPIGDPNSPNTNCGVTGVVLNEQVRDVIIYAQIKPIDGVGKILGSAGPCLVRSTSRLTIIGVMQFDSDDLNNLANSNRLEPVILHEMAHVIGFGTLWDDKTPSLLVGAGTDDPRFIGPRAQAECPATGGTTLCAGGVAVENCVSIPNCGGGTRDGHWREGSSSIPGFRTELMTGFISPAGIESPLSNMTVQSFGDLGYTVNSSAADPFSVPGLTVRALVLEGGPASLLEGETLRYPKATVSRSGLITPMERK